MGAWSSIMKMDWPGLAGYHANFDRYSCRYLQYIDVIIIMSKLEFLYILLC